jgi:Ser/Thr protein kinase RdoA (MazF antagonist)
LEFAVLGLALLDEDAYATVSALPAGLWHGSENAKIAEALRTLRIMHYAAWLARRWDDPAFPVTFPWFHTPRYWQDHILELREQVGAMDDPVLATV